MVSSSVTRHDRGQLLALLHELLDDLEVGLFSAFTAAWDLAGFLS